MKIVVSVIVCLLVAGEIAHGCSLRSCELLPVRPDFTVVVDHHGRSLAGASVRVSQRGDGIAVFEATTEENGMVRIEGLLPGKYDLVASYKDIEAGREWIEVDPTARKAKMRFTFQWADYSYEMRKVAGRLTVLEKGNRAFQYRT